MDGKLKPWHYVLFVLAIGGLAYTVYSSVFGGGPRLSDSVYLADVNSGEIFEAKIRKSLFVPATNPDTGNASLLPVSRTDGKWFLVSRYKDAVDISPVPPDAVDMATGEVRAKGDSPRRIELVPGGKMNLTITDPAKAGQNNAARRD